MFFEFFRLGSFCVEDIWNYGGSGVVLRVGVEVLSGVGGFGRGRVVGSGDVF